MDSIIFLVVSLVMLTAAAVKLTARIRDDPSSGQGLQVVLLLAFAATCVALADKIQVHHDLLPPAGWLLITNVMTVAAAFVVTVLLIALGALPGQPQKQRGVRRLNALYLCIAGMIAGLSWASPLPDATSDFNGLYATHPGLLLYSACFIAYCGITLAEILAWSIRYAGLARHRPALQAGLILVAAGSLLGLAHFGGEAWNIAAQAAHLAPLPAGGQTRGLFRAAPCLFGTALPNAALVLPAAGVAMPAWSSALSARWRRYRSRRTFTALEPLWSRLHEAFPQIRLPEPDNSRQDPALLLYRRVIEIDDGRLLLHPCLSAGASAAIATAASSRGLDGEDLRATVEAAEIAVALQAGNGEPLTPAPRPHAPTTGPADGEFSHEALWLAKISRAFVTPLVRELASQHLQT